MGRQLGRVAFIEDLKPRAVETHQSVICRKPNITVAGLR